MGVYSNLTPSDLATIESFLLAVSKRKNLSKARSYLKLVEELKANPRIVEIRSAEGNIYKLCPIVERFEVLHRGDPSGFYIMGNGDLVRSSYYNYLMKNKTEHLYYKALPPYPLRECLMLLPDPGKIFDVRWSDPRVRCVAQDFLQSMPGYPVRDWVFQLVFNQYIFNDRFFAAAVRGATRLLFVNCNARMSDDNNVEILAITNKRPSFLDETLSQFCDFSYLEENASVGTYDDHAITGFPILSTAVRNYLRSIPEDEFYNSDFPDGKIWQVALRDLALCHITEMKLTGQPVYQKEV